MDGHNQQSRKQALPSIEWLRENLRYDKETGEVWWAVPRKGRPSDRPAGYLDKVSGYWKLGSGNGVPNPLRRSRVAFALLEGRWPNCVDHINGNKQDDRWDNLREVTHAENHRNRPRNHNNKSGVTGAFWCKARNKWQVSIMVLGIAKHLGCYEDFFEAVCARKSAELKYGFHENHGRTQWSAQQQSGTTTA